jgi:glyoxylase-like metal-dependent hydrolase (beta-lactamase superfamily II)
MKIHSINTGLFKLDGGAMFGVVPKSMWQKKYPCDENNMCTWAMRCMLIEDGKQLILIDTGIGSKQDAKFTSHFYLHGNDSLQQSIAAKGYSMTDVTDVILTHLHFDHCGGAISTQKELLVPTFKNATYWSNETHWKSATAPNERERASFLKENILPIQESGQLKFIENKDGAIFNNNISLRLVNGHTESMMLPLVNYNGNNILFAADLFPSPLHINLPWIMAYDMQPLKTLAEKKLILADAVANNYTIFYEHDANIECTKLIQTERGIIAGEAFNLAEL